MQLTTAGSSSKRWLHSFLSNRISSLSLSLPPSLSYCYLSPGTWGWLKSLIQKERTLERLLPDSCMGRSPRIVDSVSSFVMRYWWLTKHKELEGSDPQRPGRIYRRSSATLSVSLSSSLGVKRRAQNWHSCQTALTQLVQDWLNNLIKGHSIGTL